MAAHKVNQHLADLLILSLIQSLPCRTGILPLTAAVSQNYDQKYRVTFCDYSLWYYMYLYSKYNDKQAGWNTVMFTRRLYIFLTLFFCGADELKSPVFWDLQP
jgi:hypothetical protein